MLATLKVQVLFCYCMAMKKSTKNRPRCPLSEGREHDMLHLSMDSKRFCSRDAEHMQHYLSMLLLSSDVTEAPNYTKISYMC